MAADALAVDGKAVSALRPGTLRGRSRATVRIHAGTSSPAVTSSHGLHDRCSATGSMASKLLPLSPHGAKRHSPTVRASSRHSSDPTELDVCSEAVWTAAACSAAVGSDGGSEEPAVQPRIARATATQWRCRSPAERLAVLREGPARAMRASRQAPTSLNPQAVAQAAHCPSHALESWGRSGKGSRDATRLRSASLPTVRPCGSVGGVPYWP